MIVGRMDRLLESRKPTDGGTMNRGLSLIGNFADLAKNCGVLSFFFFFFLFFVRNFI